MTMDKVPRKPRAQQRPDIYFVLAYCQAKDSEAPEWRHVAIHGSEVEATQAAELAYGHPAVGDVILVAWSISYGTVAVDVRPLPRLGGADEFEPAVNPDQLRRALLRAVGEWAEWTDRGWSLGWSSWWLLHCDNGKWKAVTS